MQLTDTGDESGHLVFRGDPDAIQGVAPGLMSSVRRRLRRRRRPPLDASRQPADVLSPRPLASDPQPQLVAKVGDDLAEPLPVHTTLVQRVTPALPEGIG